MQSKYCLPILVCFGFLLSLAASAKPSQEVQERRSPSALQPDPNRSIRGKVTFLQPLPKDAAPEIIVEGTGILSAKAREKHPNNDFPYHEYARVKIAPNGTFEVPRAIDSDFIWGRVEGDYCYGSMFWFEVGSPEDPGKIPLELECDVKAHVTYELLFPPEATEEDKRKLIGRIVLMSRNPNEDVNDWGGGPYASRVTDPFPIDENFEVAIPHTASKEMWYTPGGAAGEYKTSLTGFESPSAALAPFVAVLPVRFQVSSGERARFPMQLEWSPKIHGRALGPNGDAIEGAQITVQKVPYPSHQETEGFTYLATSASDGSFVMHGLPPRDLLLEARFPLNTPTRWGPSRLGSARSEGQEILLVMQPPASPKNSQDAATLPPPATFYGQVRWPQGNPPNPTEVAVRYLSGGKYYAIEFSEEPGQDGRFAFPAQPDAEHTISAVAQGIDGKDASSGTELTATGTSRAKDTTANNPMQLRLQSAASLRIRVLEEGSDTPVKCNVRFGHGDVASLAESRTEWTRLQFSNANGDYYRSRLEPKTYTVQASLNFTRHLQRVATKEVKLLPAENEVTLILPASRSVSGLVVDESGNGLANAAIVLKRKDGQGETQRLQAIESDETGRFQTMNIPPGEYTVAVDVEHKVMVPDLPFEVGKGSPPTDWKIVMKEGAYIKAMVLDSHGDPVSRAVLSAVNKAGQDLGRYSRKETDPLGEVTIGPLPPGPVSILQRKENDLGAYQIRRSLTVPLGENATVVFDSSSPSALLAGVLTSGEEPLRGYQVWTKNDAFLYSFTESDASGRFELPLHDLGQFELTVSGPGMPADCLRKTIAVKPGANQLPIDLPTGAIQGWVEGTAEDQYLPNVFAVRVGEDLLTPYPTSEARVETGSGFVLPHLPDGRYSLVLRKSSREGGMYLASKPIRVEVAGGKMTEGVVLQPTY